MKRLTALFTTVTLLFALSPAAALATSANYSEIPITLNVNGQYIAADTQPIIDRGRTLAPLRAAVESLGATVAWDNAAGTATVQKDGKEIRFTQGQQSYTVDGQPHPLDVPLQNRGGRVLIPLRALGNALDVTVDWKNDSREVRITDYRSTIATATPPAYTAPEIQWLISKYYKAPSSIDPYTGSWHGHLTKNEPGTPATQEEYLFISPLSTGNYHMTRLKTSPEADGTTRIEVYNCNATASQGTFKADWNGQMIYYRGLGIDTPSDGQETFTADGTSLISTRYYLDFLGDILDTPRNDRFERF